MKIGGHSISHAFSNPVAAIANPVNAITGSIAQRIGPHINDVANRALNNPAAALSKGIAYGSTMGLGGLPTTAGEMGFGSGSSSNRSIMPGVGGNDYLLGGRTAHIQAEANAADQASLDAQNERQNKLISDLYAKFGVGQGGDAAANARAIEGQKTNILNAYQLQQQSQADQNYAQNLTAARAGAASSGQLNSSNDVQARNKLYQAYAGQQAATQAGKVNAGQAFDTGLQNQRQSYEDMIRGRTVTNTTNMGADIAQLRNASGQAFSNAAASALPIAANLGSNYALAGAYGQSAFNKPFGRS